MADTPELEGPPTRQELALRDLPTPIDTVFVAKSPMEMAEAQEGLLVWAREKLAHLRSDYDEMEEAYNHARKMKWKASPMRRQMTKIQKHITYYTKVEAALAEGYYLIPNFPVDVVAIRTRREFPKHYETTERGSLGMEQESDASPMGEGTFVSPTPRLDSEYRERTDHQGKKKLDKWFWPDRFEPFDFPFTVTKPEIIDGTKRAMVKKVFDEIGILPQRQRRRGDPMIIGQVVLREGYSEKRLSFLIAWFVDTNTL
jgi:hypothetical protein